MKTATVSTAIALLLATAARSDDSSVVTQPSGAGGGPEPTTVDFDGTDMHDEDKGDTTANDNLLGTSWIGGRPLYIETNQGTVAVGPDDKSMHSISTKSKDTMADFDGTGAGPSGPMTKVDQDDMMRPDMTGVNGSMVNPMLTDTDQDDMMVMTNVTGVNGTMTPVLTEVDQDDMMRPDMTGVNGSMANPMLTDTDQDDMMVMRNVTGVNGTTTPVLTEVDQDDLMRPDMTGVNGSMVNPMLTDTDQDDMMVMTNMTNINDSIAATNAAVVTPDGSCVPVSVEGDATYCVQGPVCSGSGSVPAGWSCPRMGDMATADCHDTLASYGTAGCILPETSICRPLNTGVWGCVLSSVADNISTTPAIVSSAMYRPDTVNMTGVSGIMVNSMLTDTDQDDMMVMSNVTNINDSIAATNAAVVTPDGSCVPVSVEGDATYCVQGPVCSGSGSVPAGWSCPRMGDMATADCHDTLASYGTAGCILPETSICRPLNTGVWGCVLSSVADNSSTTPAIGSSAMYRPDTVNMTGVSGSMVNPMLTDTDQDDMMVMSNVTNINDSIAATNAAVVTPDGSCVPVSVEGDATYCVQGPVCSGSGSVPAGWSCPRMGDMATADCHDTLASYGTAGCILPETSICRPLNTGVWGCVLSSVADNISTTPAIVSSAMYRPDTVNMTGVSGIMVNSMLTDTDQDDMMVMSNVTNINDSIAATNAAVVTPDGSCVPVSVEGDATYCVQGPVCSGSGSVPAGWSCPRMGDMATADCHDTLASYGTAGCILPETSICRPLNTGVWGCVLSSVADNISTTPAIVSSAMYRPDTVNMTGVSGIMVNSMLTDTDQDDMMVMSNVTNINDSIAATNAAVVTPDGSCVPVSVEGDATYCVQGPVCSGSGSVPAGWSCPRMGDMATADCHDTLASYGTAGCILPETSICRPLNTGVWGCVLSSVADNISTTPAIVSSAMYRPDTVNMTGVSGIMVNSMLTDTDQDDMMVMSNVTNINDSIAATNAAVVTPDGSCVPVSVEGDATYCVQGPVCSGSGSVPAGWSCPRMGDMATADCHDTLASYGTAGCILPETSICRPLNTGVWGCVLSSVADNSSTTPAIGSSAMYRPDTVNMTGVNGSMVNPMLTDTDQDDMMVMTNVTGVNGTTTPVLTEVDQDDMMRPDMTGVNGSMVNPMLTDTDQDDMMVMTNVTGVNGTTTPVLTEVDQDDMMRPDMTGVNGSMVNPMLTDTDQDDMMVMTNMSNINDSIAATNAAVVTPDGSCVPVSVEGDATYCVQGPVCSGSGSVPAGWSCPRMGDMATADCHDTLASYGTAGCILPETSICRPLNTGVWGCVLSSVADNSSTTPAIGSSAMYRPDTVNMTGVNGSMVNPMLTDTDQDDMMVMTNVTGVNGTTTPVLTEVDQDDLMRPDMTGVNGSMVNPMLTDTDQDDMMVMTNVTGVNGTTTPVLTEVDQDDMMRPDMTGVNGSTVNPMLTDTDQDDMMVMTNMTNINDSIAATNAAVVTPDGSCVPVSVEGDATYCVQGPVCSGSGSVPAGWSCPRMGDMATADCHDTLASYGTAGCILPETSICRPLNTGVWGCVLSSVADNISTTPAIVSSAMYRPDTVNMTGVSGIMVNSMLTDTDQDDMMVMSNVTNINDSIAATNAAVVTPDGSCVPVSVEGDATYCVQGPVCSGSGSVPAGWSCPRMGDMATADCHDTLASYGTAGCILPETSICRPLNTGVWGCVLSSVADNSSTTPAIGSSAMYRPDTVNMTGVNGSMVNPMLTDTDQDDMMVMTNVTGVNGTTTPVLTEVDQDDMMRPDMTGVNGSMVNPMLTDTDQDDMMVMTNVTGVNGTTTPVLTEVDQDDMMRPDMTGVNGSMVNPMLTDTDQDDMMVMTNMSNINDSIAATNAAVVTPDGSCVPVSVEGDATYCVQGPVCSGSGSVPAGWSCPRMGDMATADCHDTLASYGTAGCILPETSICRPLNTGVWGCVLSSVADNSSTTPAIGSSAMYRPDTVNMTGVNGSMVNPMLTDTDQDDMMVMTNVTGVNGTTTPVLTEVDQDDLMRPDMTGVNGSMVNPMLTDTDQDDMMVMTNVTGVNGTTTPVLTEVDQDDMMRPDMTGVNGSMVNPMLTDTDQDDMMVMTNMTNINDSIAATNAAVVTPDGSCVPVSVEGDATYCVQGPVCSGSGSVPAGWSCPRMGDMATADCNDTLASYGTAGCILPETSICRPLNTGVWGCVLSSVADNSSTTPAIRASVMAAMDPNSASDDSSSFSVFAAVGIGAACVVAVAAFVLFKKRQRKSAEASQLAHQTFVDVKTP